VRIDVGSVDGSRRVAAPAAVPGSRSGTVGIQSDDISIQPNGMQATASHESEVLDGQLALSDELTLALGLTWTRQNPVWTSQALNRMRSLQHVLMKKAFSLSQDSRQPVLEGVKVLESAIALRVRLEAAMYEQEQALLRGSHGSELDPTTVDRDARAQPMVRVA
jgi:hypothetical protein